MTSQEKTNEENFISNLVKQSFHTTSLTLLSLLLPLSFLHLPRLTSPPPNCRITSIILYILVLALSSACLRLSLAGRSPTIKPPKSISWVILIIFQLCVSWAIRATIVTAFEPIGDQNFGVMIWVKRTFVFIGIYRTTMLWRRMIVKPVVDDTVYGEERKERGVERVVMGVAFIASWMWILRMEAEPLVFDGEKERLGKVAGWNGFALWMVGLEIVMIGSLRVVEVLLGTIMAAVVVIIRWRKQKNEDCIEDKV